MVRPPKPVPRREDRLTSDIAVLAHTAAGFDETDRRRVLVVGASRLAGIAYIARSAIAVMVGLGLTPGLAGLTAPSQIRRFW